MAADRTFLPRWIAACGLAEMIGIGVAGAVFDRFTLAPDVPPSGLAAAFWRACVQMTRPFQRSTGHRASAERRGAAPEVQHG